MAIGNGEKTSAVLASMGGRGHEQVVFGRDAATGLEVIIAIHSTVLGPALGGTRFRPYRSEEDALVDALRLSESMTVKAALAGLDLGGGKAVIIGDPAVDKTPALLEAYGRTVASLGGRFITGEDMGISAEDVDIIARTAAGCVAGGTPASGGSGDPSPWTARGVALSIDKVADRVLGAGGLTGLSVAVSGIGKVGSALVDRLVAGGARVVVADVSPLAIDRIRRAHPSVSVVDPSEIHRQDVDVFAPCAAGAVLSSRTIPELRCAAVIGSANNQLATRDDAERLADRGVLYAPDFLVNAGGLISISDELTGWDEQRVAERVDAIGDTLITVLDRARATGQTPNAAALALAGDRLAASAHAA